MGFLADTESAVTAGFTTVANTFGAELLGVFQPAFIIGFTIWLMLIAYGIAFGSSEDSFTYIFTKIGKIFLIGVLALYGWPSLAELLNGVKDGFVGSNTISTILENNLMNPLTDLWVSLYRWFTASITTITMLDIGRVLWTIVLFDMLLFAYLVMTVIVAVFSIVALAMYLVANSMFILLMAIGPFFLLCLAFPFTQRFFETYIGNVMTTILAMAFTVLMVMFVAGLFGLVGIDHTVPFATDEHTVTENVKSLAVLFFAKGAMALLIIYLCYKVFDLASALGGGLNMGNNLVGGVRNIMNDMQRGSRGGRAIVNNSISHGNGGGNNESSSGNSGASARARNANSGYRTFTGMAVGAASPVVSSAANAGVAAARGTARLAAQGIGTVGRYAYNRYSALSNRKSAP